jgi:hypothetical protein
MIAIRNIYNQGILNERSAKLFYPIVPPMAGSGKKTDSVLSVLCGEKRSLIVLTTITK